MLGSQCFVQTTHVSTAALPTPKLKVCNCLRVSTSTHAVVRLSMFWPQQEQLEQRT